MFSTTAIRSGFDASGRVAATAAPANGRWRPAGSSSGQWKEGERGFAKLECGGVTQFRVMTRNVENLFAVGAEAGPATEAELAAKIESLKAVIDAQRPDLVALQEVGG
jgi:hypothetical protein